jgi:NTP pyrophosphatase (non-canonical NTP hydrolase)
MTYYLYHIPGKKIGVTRDLKYRVEEQQGYNEGEYDVILSTDDIGLVSEAEISLQKAYGYKVDEIPYNELKFNEMNINVTEQTTTFPCPINKLKGQLMDNLNMKWETEHGPCIITNKSVDWIMKNVVTSKYNDQRCYVYNKAFARWFDNNDAVTRTGGIMSDHRENGINMPKSHFDLIRKWASKRGLYEKGDPKTQALKLVEEVGETCRAILKGNHTDIEDGIGDCVVVLTNLAHLCDTDIEHCIELAYNEIKDRKGKMSNGTFKKD